MTSSLRVRASIVLLLGTLLIPVATSSLRGLTHVLSCRSPVAAKFDVAVPTQGKEPVAVLLEPTAVTRGGAPDHITRPAPGETSTTVADDSGHITRPAGGSSSPTVTTAPAVTTAPVVTTTAPPVTITVPAPTTTTVPRAKPAPVCGGITIDMKLSAPSPGWVRIDLPISNSGRHNWKGTVQLQVGSKSFPVELGSIPPGQTRSKSIEVKVDTTVDRVTGDLLLGP